jgi:hypothetical protein
MAVGQKTGGRRKGTPNKATAAKVEEIAASGLTPLDHMLTVMRDKSADPQRRDVMARSAAPYVHPKLASVEVGGEDGGPVQVLITGDDLGLL